MEKDILTLLDNEKEEKYRLLSVIDNNYIIYTTIDNFDPTRDINILKIKSLSELETIPITDQEIKMIEKKYLSLLK